MKNVIFVCIHNSARSQMAEAFLNQIGGSQYRAESAGLEPGTLNPLAVAVMEEAGLDISHNSTRRVAEVIATGKVFDFVITVCDEASAERCPMFPGGGTRLHWGLPDPSGFQGGWEERLQQTRSVRDAIAERVRQFCMEAEN